MELLFYSTYWSLASKDQKKYYNPLRFAKYFAPPKDTRAADGIQERHNNQPKTGRHGGGEDGEEE
jgi:hypothetical protein